MALTVQQKLDRLIRSFPKVFKGGQNPVLTALLEAIATADSEVTTQIDNAKAQLFVATASGKYLKKLASSRGVEYPSEIGLSDDLFRELIPNLSFKAKQLKKSLYDTSDVFWGPLFSRTNTQTLNFAPFNISSGDKLSIQIDDGVVQEIKVLEDDIVEPGEATAAEVVTILSRIAGATVISRIDALTGNESVNIRTNTPGPVGSIKIIASTSIGSSKLDFPVGKTELRLQTQRVSIYNINPNELIIEIPATLPALARHLKGSHHFHADSTIEEPVAPENGVWKGSFVFDVAGEGDQHFTVTSKRAVLDQNIEKGKTYNFITVTGADDLVDESGRLVFSFGLSNEEHPIKFYSLINSKTVALDPTYRFTEDHVAGEYLNVVDSFRTYIPNKFGNDYAVYITDTEAARDAAEIILQSITAAGILITFVVLLPDYKYLIDNPFDSSDDG